MKTIENEIPELRGRLSADHVSGADQRRTARVGERSGPYQFAEELRHFYWAEDRKRHRRKLLFHGAVLLALSLAIAWGIWRAF